MAGKTSRTGLQFVQKKLLGKANTSNLKSDAQELIGSTVQLGSQTIFGQSVPGSPSTTPWAISGGTVEYVLFNVVPIAGTTYDGNDADAGGDEAQSPGPHAYALKLPSNYQSLSSNPKAGTGYFVNGYCLTGSLGGLQIIPQNYSTVSPNPYIPIIYVDSGGSPGAQIPLLDEVDWSLDTYSGVLFLQDYDPAKVPAFLRGHLYVGDYLIDVTGSGGGGGGGGGGDPAAQYLVLSATGSLTAERVFTPGTGLQANDGGSGNPYTVSVNDSVVATLTGSVFSGPVVAGGGLTGSLQQVSAGVPYLVAGPNITINTSSLGQISITGSAGGGGSPAGIDTSVQYNNGGSFGGNNTFVYTQSTDTLKVTNLSGSLTRLSNGSSYLVAGSNVTISTGSNGQVTISSTGGGGGGGGVLTIASARRDTSYPHNTYSVFAMGSYEISGPGTFRSVVAAPSGYTVYVRLTDFTAGGTTLIELSSTSTIPVTVSGPFTPTDTSRRVYTVEVKVSGTPDVNQMGIHYGSTIEVP